MKRQILKMLATGLLLALPAIANAATNGFATTNVNMRSGPSTRYPAVVVVPAGAPIVIHGCLNNVNWCDVSFARGRGWVSGSYIQAGYQQRRVYVDPQYYRPLGIPTITFDVDTYWQRYYRDRDFYRERDRWRGWDYRRDVPPPPRYYDSRRDDPIRDPNRFREDGRYRYEDRYRLDDRYRYDNRGGDDRGDPRGERNWRDRQDGNWDNRGDGERDRRRWEEGARPDDRRGPPPGFDGCTPDRPCSPPGR